MNTNKPLNITGYKDKHVYQSAGGITSTVYLMDCMDFLQQVPEKYFDLAVVDPPYGIGATKEMGLSDKRRGNRKVSKWGNKKWDDNRPGIDYFSDLQKASKNTIVWGGNYFSDYLPASRCWLIWDKMQRIDQADAELAWTSFNGSVRVFSFHVSKLIGFQNPNRFHPTEKPVPLYDWIYQNYAKPGQVILDTHLGSGSNRIAAHKNNLELVGVELDPEYFYASVKRFEQYTSQLTLF